MKATEFRIGNLLNHYGNTVTVMEILKNNRVELGYFTDSIGFVRSLDDENIKPIPLTEEWLIKFGFEKDYEGDFMFSFNGRTYYYNLEKGYLMKDFKAKIKLNQFPFYYVHQLQNLYFALTNQELNLNL